MKFQSAISRMGIKVWMNEISYISFKFLKLNQFLQFEYKSGILYCQGDEALTIRQTSAFIKLRSSLLYSQSEFIQSTSSNSIQFCRSEYKHFISYALCKRSAYWHLRLSPIGPISQVGLMYQARQEPIVRSWQILPPVSVHEMGIIHIYLRGNSAPLTVFLGVGNLFSHHPSVRLFDLRKSLGTSSFTTPSVAPAYIKAEVVQSPRAHPRCSYTYPVQRREWTIFVAESFFTPIPAEGAPLPEVAAANHQSGRAFAAGQSWSHSDP